MGVVSGTALDTVLIRRLQDGDPGGDMRRALAALPIPGLAATVLKRWFQPEGRAPGEAYRLKRMPSLGMRREDVELLIAAGFVEVFLAKEGHDGWVGINLLEKIQLTTLPILLGAMLAEVDAVLMGGGIPLAIPGALDAFAELRAADLKVQAVGLPADEAYRAALDPRDFLPASLSRLNRPLFFPVVSSEVLAKTLLKKANGRVDGFVVEHHRAGGHNAPPRRDGCYGPRDECSIERMRDLDRPFWLAGGRASPEGLREALELGAAGVQLGTAFAGSEESGILPEIKAELIELHLRGELKVETDFQASPTGYPFKRVDLAANAAPEPCRTCDLGYLRQVYRQPSGEPGYRCPAAPVEAFLAKGGSEAETEGKRCLCNGLLATIGLGQTKDGITLPPLLTWGEDCSFFDALLAGGRRSYRAAEVIDYLLGGLVGRESVANA